MRPDIVVCSVVKKDLIIIELMVPFIWTEDYCTFKSKKYTDLVRQV